jgi:pyruvate, orthophosphate dikinase
LDCHTPNLTTHHYDPILVVVTCVVESRFLEMFGNVVLGIPRAHFEDELDDIKYERGVNEDTDLSAEDLQEIVARFKNVYETMGMTFPQDVLEQLKLASKSLSF